MQAYVALLLQTLDEAGAEFSAASPAAAAHRPGAGVWSPKEILGHLIDSAANNHHRFVRAQWQDDLVFPGYDQEAWVATQRYHEAPWLELITLWQGYNRHLARVMAATPPAVLTRQHLRHNLDQIAWRTVPRGQPATLDYFMNDYVAHLHHHVAQIRERLAAGAAR
jgi:hypothetical protein